MNEYNLLSHAERIAYCRTKLREAQELEEHIRQLPWTPDLAEAIENVHFTQREFSKALEALEKPSLWRRINFAVNDAWARTQVKDDIKRRRTRIRCALCRGTGRRISDTGGYYVACGCGGRDLGFPDADPEIMRATGAADRLRGEIRGN
ncbi:hypothetical protein KOI35_00965 [Actinoplanes bogorensis]|uniref:DksA C4-type domain-containing protein n=1 Tax=Paractinoplanes bogorensis TaxID=1610840 RepID=A0ABS5YF40_9ACTN|nr:hypothetical protein [Actinoplanes bogorensis]MBU2662068.1 hypothetical protein [Actinoplanes bogorensis]